MRLVHLQPTLPPADDEVAEAIELRDRFSLDVAEATALLAEQTEQIQTQRVGEVENRTKRVLSDAATEVSLGASGVEERIAVPLEGMGASPQAAAGQ